MSIIQVMSKEYYTGNDPVKQNTCPLDPVEEAKILIVDKITRHLSDVIFEKVCTEMGKSLCIPITKLLN